MVEDNERYRGRYIALKKGYDKLRNDNPYLIVPSLGDLVLTKPIQVLVDGVQALRKEWLIASIISLESPLFTQLAEGWRALKEEELFQMLPSDPEAAITSTSAATKVAILDRATTVFRCNAVGCGKYLFYPYVLTHPCASSPTFQPLTSAPAKEQDHSDAPTPFAYATLPLLPEACRVVDSVPWNSGGNRIFFDPEASAHAKAIVEACGLDPAYATAADIVMMNLTFECVTCRSSGEGEMPRMRWPQVVSTLQV